MTSSGSAQVPLLHSPQRLVDTRTTGGLIPSGTSRCFVVAGMAGIPADAAGAILNVTTVSYGGSGWLTVYAGGQPVPQTSTLNFDRTEYAIANGNLVRLGPGGQVCVAVGTLVAGNGGAQVILDVTGYVKR